MRLSKWTRVIVFAVAVTGISASAFGQGRGGGPPDVKPGGGPPGGVPGGGPGEETAANNLSVPAILVGDSLLFPNLAFPIGYWDPENDVPIYLDVPPSGVPLTGYPVAGYYYVQGVHQWQASTLANPGGTIDAYAAWGDNLTGSASLTTKSPIRVEVGLLAANEAGEPDGSSYGMTGWEVLKLDLDALDRDAPYGTEAIDANGGSYPILSDPEVRVFTTNAWLTIFKVGEEDNPVVDEPASAEVNSTGRIVYGYNLRVKELGTYVIQFSVGSGVNIVGADAGDVLLEGTLVELTIEVAAAKGRGGRPGTAPGQQK